MLIIAVTAVLVALWITWMMGSSWSWGDFSVGLLFGSLMGLMFAIAAGMIITKNPERHRGRATALENIADGSSEPHGSFFLGSGSVDSQSAYMWYERSGNNSYVQRSADTGKSVVHFIGRGRPRVVRTYESYSDDGGINLLYVNPGRDSRIVKYDFYVPRGTIKRDYTLDAK